MAKKEQHEQKPEEREESDQGAGEQEAGKKTRNVKPRTPISRELYEEITATKAHLEGRFKAETVDAVVADAIDEALKGKTIDLMRAHARRVSEF